MSVRPTAPPPEVRRLRPAHTPLPFPARAGPGLLNSARHAWNGLLHTVLHQRNMRLHVVAAVLVGLVGSGIPLGLAEKVTLIFCVALVFFAEILNTALEHLVDLAVQQFDEKARVAKDAAAAGVLVLALGTFVIFAALVVHNWETVQRSGEMITRQVVLGLPLAALIAVLLEPFRRPAWVDALLFGAGMILMGALSRRTESVVFTTLTAGILVLAGTAAHRRQRFLAEKEK